MRGDTPKRVSASMVLGVGRFAAGCREGQQDGLFDQPAEAAHITTQKEIAHAEQQRPQQGQAEIELANQLAITHQHAQPFRRDGGRHGGKHAQRRESHDVVGHAEHHLGQFINGRNDGGVAAAPHKGKRCAEKQREHQNLKDFIVGHGFHDAAREDMGNESLEREVAGFQAGGGAGVGQGQAQLGAGLEQIDQQEAQQQGGGRGDDKPQHGAQTDAADRSPVSHTGQA